MCGGGGGGPKNTTSEVTQTNIPDWAQPYAMRSIGQASALTDLSQNPYQSYGGQRIADFSPLQQQAYSSVGNLQPSTQMNQAAGMAGLAGLGGLNTNRFGQPAADFYMSPYMQNVVGMQQRDAVRQADIAGNQRGYQAATSGAFGGTRHALADSEANRALGFQLGDIQAKGLQASYDQAQRQFNADEDRRLQGYGVTLQGANALGQIGQELFGQRMGIIDAQREAGSEQQSLAQQALNFDYQDFLDRMNYPYKQLGFMSDILRGQPATDTTTTIYGPKGSAAGQTAGLLGGLGSLYMSTQTKKGS